MGMIAPFAPQECKCDHSHVSLRCSVQKLGHLQRIDDGDRDCKTTQGSSGRHEIEFSLNGCIRCWPNPPKPPKQRSNAELWCAAGLLEHPHVRLVKPSPGTSHKGIATSNQKLLVTKGIATRNKCVAISSQFATSSKKLLVAKGISTRSKDATSSFLLLVVHTLLHCVSQRPDGVDASTTAERAGAHVAWHDAAVWVLGLLEKQS